MTGVATILPLRAAKRRDASVGRPMSKWCGRVSLNPHREKTQGAAPGFKREMADSAGRNRPFRFSALQLVIAQSMYNRGLIEECCVGKGEGFATGGTKDTEKRGLGKFPIRPGRKHRDAKSRATEWMYDGRWR